MGVEWQSRDFLTDWTGLFNRLQSIDVPASYSRTARNVDFWGSAIGKRMGTRIVNGWASLTTAPWTQVGGTQTGPVADASGYRVTDQVLFVTAAGTGVTGGAITAISGNTLTISASGALPVVGTAVVARRDLGARVDGLYHAVFRDGTEQLLAASGGNIWNVWGTSINGGVSYAPVALTTKFPTTTIPSNWAPSFDTGPITNAETVVAANQGTFYDIHGTILGPSAYSPDCIQIIHAGTVIYEGTIALFQSNPTPVITLSSVAFQPPQAGDTVVFFPHRTAGDTRFTMFNNRVYVTSANAKNPVFSGPQAAPVQRQPPVVIEQSAPNTVPYIRRMGIRAPTTPASAAFLGTPGPLTGGYSWRYTFVNLLNGQESEGSPAVNLSNWSNNTVTVHLQGTTDPQVSQINVYRTLTDQDGSWYFVGSVPNVVGGGATVFNDTIPDAGLGQLLKTFSNEPPPDTLTYLAVWTQAGALIGIDSGSIAEGGENVAWSDAPDIVNGVYKLESWPINNTLFVNRDDGDHLVSLGVFYDSVVVWKGRSMHRIVGAPPDIILQPISFRDDHTGVGIWSAKGFIMDTDVAIFVSDDGFYQVSRYDGVAQGFTSSRISRAIDQEFYARTGFGGSAMRANRERSHLLYHRVKRRLQAFLPVDGNANPTDQFIYQMEGTVDGTPHGWSEWSVPRDYAVSNLNPITAQSFVSASCMVNAMGGIDYPHYGCGVFGLVVKADTGAGEWQTLPVTIMSDTVWFSPGGAGTVCRGRSVDFVFTPQAGLPQPILRYGTDFNAPDRFQLPTLGNLAMAANENPLVLELGQYHSVGFEETSVTGLFLVNDFTLWFQRLPVGVTQRLIPTPIPPTVV